MTKTSKPSAQKKMMDMIARREHSEAELRQKLEMSQDFTQEEIDAAILHAKARKWIPDSEESSENMSAQLAEGLHRKLKGILFINQYLLDKGLPPVESDSAFELEKAQTLVKNKYSSLEKADEQTRAKAGRFLASRGFDESIVGKVIYEEF